ncbi:MAG: RNA 2',3'-cyclic phosphodiesterase [Candidatus Komeilibacteria bacterium CG11_big_fil_rev_8_21_14_0_20_36_20]|uniref:RNA 2',3'-cyclic phosphodiesterase n=1 Tax=Candidatus Komeilibacteria bacterium CG11_big_fil_rev_8_21_14_0_20_36_20 TaxID=1974477 RepID=A0A2H0NBX9_9BACT|nr:MAG: RNA 2',3'-cyclic phosphodiesterase [Candidatus Komeilibacteria bacterium CG11_big_fil_rev_8_21_14_0_20_36_20]PIR81976.1 MAG: RNA 2',3'-cyclic phosphodiesterase [Candidatus Komeilibacteria bacterium CG10_big_fil_rev_8_21_14_0_10_36_65]PJC55514.1 MAG: RNA 2',3'-cyclic phosphodiesterase [Candidatus Komeilibacteria bacterium CG_4_9_14_0_2_um_filter_36_13]
MNYLRLFISLPVDAATTREITKKFTGLNLPWEKLKLIQPDQIHLTLKFLGDTPIDKIPPLIATLQEIKLNFQYLELTIENSIIFNSKTPKVLALKIKENKKLQTLFKAIEEKLFSAGLAHRENKKFSAHLNLARIKKTSQHKEFAKFTDWQVHKIIQASYFELKESVLTKKGPEYTTLQTFDL